MVATRDSRSRKYSDTNILINTGSTCSVFKNEHMLINIVKSRTIIPAIPNSGHQDSDHVGLFSGFFEVYFNPESLFNILLMRGRVIMDQSCYRIECYVL